MQHFANFTLSGEQLKTQESLNYLRQNDPEEYKRVIEAGKGVAKRNKNIALGTVQNKVAAGGNADQLYKQNAQNYNQAFVKGTNANQAASVMGKVGNTAKRYGKVAAGLGGAAMTASMILPSVMGMLPQKPQPEQEQPY